MDIKAILVEFSKGCSNTTGQIPADCDECLSHAVELIECKIGNWQPIETAPRDGSAIIIGCNYHRHGKSQVTLAWYVRGMWAEGMYWDDDEEEFLVSQCEFRPSHWMPLPDAPKD